MLVEKVFVYYSFNEDDLQHFFAGIFPEPNVDPIIQIANVVKLHGEKDILYRNIFTLNSCASIGHAEVSSYQRILMSINLVSIST